MSEVKKGSAESAPLVLGETKMTLGDGSQLSVQELAPRAERARRGMRRTRDDNPADGKSSKLQKSEAEQQRPLAKRPHVDVKSKEKESRPDRKYECAQSIHFGRFFSLGFFVLLCNVRFGSYG